jgi:hypothetical protein
MTMDNLPKPGFDVFLSHAHVDADIVEKLAARLADEGHFNIWRQMGFDTGGTLAAKHGERVG